MLWPLSEEEIQSLNRLLNQYFDQDVIRLIERAVRRARQKNKAFVGFEDLVLELQEDLELWERPWPQEVGLPREAVLRWAQAQDRVRWETPSARLQTPVPSRRLARVLEEVAARAANRGGRAGFAEIVQEYLRNNVLVEELYQERVLIPFAPPDPEWEAWLAELRAVRTISHDPPEDLSGLLEHLGVKPLAHQAVGREEELHDLSQALEATSVLLVGPARVGKTFLVEELARRLWRGQRRRIARVVTYRLEAGAGIVGVFEARVKALFDFAIRHNVILFIDEFDAVIGTGVALGRPQGFATYLLEGIDRGLRVIASLTPQGFEILKIHQQGNALLGRFAIRHVREIPREELPRAFRAALPRNDLDDVIIRDVLELGDRFLRWQPQPAKGIRWLKIAAQRLSRGASLTREALADVVARELNVPYHIVRAALDRRRLVEPDRLKELLRQEVVGQDEAIEIIVETVAFHCDPIGDAVLRSERSPFRPRAVFLFFGPPGTGKTLTAKLLAESLFGKDALIKFSMTTYRGPDGRIRLLGSPFGRRGELATKVGEKPCCVLLFDEFDKAPEQFDLFLPILYDGEVTGQGEIVYFSDAIIVLTTNLEPREPITITPECRRDQLLSLRRAFPSLPEPLLDRIDCVVEFKPLTMEHLEEIVARQIARMNDRVLQPSFGIRCSLDEAAKRRLAERAYHEGTGAREVERVIMDNVLAKIADFRARNPRFQGTVRVIYEDDEFQLIPQEGEVCPS